MSYVKECETRRPVAFRPVASDNGLITLTNSTVLNNKQEI